MSGAERLALDAAADAHYCDRKHLSVHERLALFIKVCEGVQHAHQKAIMHRDLKPSNILVVEVDGKPMPRIIDFGIAKAIPQQAEAETLLTRAGGMVGTLVSQILFHDVQSEYRGRYLQQEQSRLCAKQP